MSACRQVTLLRNKVAWFGEHSGYECLSEALPTTGLSTRTFSPKVTVARRLAGKAISVWRGYGRVAQADVFARWQWESYLWRHPRAVGHILYGEEHLEAWSRHPVTLRQRAILTLHQPRSQWSENVSQLHAASHSIVLYRRDLEFFREKTGGAVTFIPHGADTDYFSPAANAPEGIPRLLFSGVHLRNLAMLGRVIHRLSHRELLFDLLIPPRRRSHPVLTALAAHASVRWHAGLDDHQLRELYRSAYLMLLPMQDSGANTAVVEALASGLPIVTTDVGGIRDYGGGTIFPVIENDDDDAMIALIELLLDNPSARTQLSRDGRCFAESTLAWPLIAQQHLLAYSRLAV